MAALKQALRKSLVEWDESLHMIGKAGWKIEGITDPKSFFEHLPKIFPYGGTLLLEGMEMGLTTKSHYEEHPAIYTRKVACDGLIPTPESYHVAFDEKFSDGLCQIIKSQGLVRAFYHFKGYSEREILFTFHDAFAGPLYVSSSINETTVKEFANALGCRAELIPFIYQGDYLRAVDRALNPPWWRRILKFFGKKTD